VHPLLPDPPRLERDTCPDPKAIAGLIPEVRPEFFFSPPRLWEKLRAGVLATTGDVPEGDAASAALGAIGFDALRVAIVGAAPCPPEVVRFWHAIGVPLCEVYGMSETTGLVAVNPPDAVRIGTVGPPLPSVEVRLGEADEVLVRGANVMPGYRNLPEKTAEALDPDGWLHTGDVGASTTTGYLRSSTA
jgi:long-subunit acyl-CoA synthetase (AMP-forming)